MGYNIGPIETGVTVGKTQFIGRDGNLDKYSCYSARLSFKPGKTQRLSFLYYGYTVDNTMIAGDGFFKNASISTPSFFQPVHILSSKYDVAFSQYLKLDAEVASSFRSSAVTRA